jgi:hypothetical protein
MIEKMLDELHDLQCKADYLRITKDSEIKGAIPDDIQKIIDAIKEKYSEIVMDVDEEISMLANEIKEQVKATGESVKGEHLSAVYTKPRVTWDSKGIEGFSVAHPEINVFRKVGEPSVSIKAK